MLAVGYRRGAAPVPRDELAELVQGLGKPAITTVSRRSVASAAVTCCVSIESFYSRAALSFGQLEVLAVGYSRGAAPVPRVQLGELVEDLGKHAITTVSRRGVWRRQLHVACRTNPFTREQRSCLESLTC